MVRSSLVWTWWSESVRVSPTALACCTPTEPIRRRQAARPARLNARETLPKPACCAAQTRTCDLVPTGSLQTGYRHGFSPAVVVWLTQSYRDGLMRNYLSPRPRSISRTGRVWRKSAAEIQQVVDKVKE